MRVMPYCKTCLLKRITNSSVLKGFSDQIFSCFAGTFSITAMANKEMK